LAGFPRPFTAYVLPPVAADREGAEKGTALDDRQRNGTVTQPQASLRKVAGPYLTVREVADRLRVCTDTVYEMVKRGDLAHVRVSNVIRIPRSALP
jgi:excisionase family DNA binding protein